MGTVRTGSQFPTQAVILPFEHSKGPQAVETYEQSGRRAQDWQKLLITDIMATGPDGLYVHQKFGYEVPRQNGKGEVIAMRELQGIIDGERICHTAHKTSTSHSAFVRLMKLLTDAGFVEVLRRKKGAKMPDKSFKATKQYGLEQIFMNDGGYIVFRTRTEAGGIGESFDTLIIDEAQEYTQTQQGALMYTIAASPNPQTVFCGTPPTPQSKGDVFAPLRDRVLSGNAYDTGWAEWSVYQMPADIMDVDTWYATNPSLGTLLKERTIRGEDVNNVLDFVIQRLGFWHRYELKSEITEKDWNALRVPYAPTDLTGKIHAAVKFGADGANTALSIAIKTRRGKTFIECIDCAPQREGLAWIVDWLAGCKNLGSVLVDGKGAADLLLAELAKECPKVTTFAPKYGEFMVACSGFRQAIDAETIEHTGQPSVTQAVSNCERRLIGNAGGFGFRSLSQDIEGAIVESLALAHYGASIAKERKKPKVWY